MPYSTTQIVTANQSSSVRNVDTVKMSRPQGRRGEIADSPHLLRSPSFLEQHPLDHSVPIPEEDEDETSSEPAEAITPTSDSHPPFSHHGVDAMAGLPPTTTPVKPLIINTAATPTPPHTKSQNASIKPGKPSPTAGTVLQQSKPHTRSIRSLFRRSNSNAVDQMKNSPFILASSKTNGMAPPRRKPSFSTSHSPATSQSNSPPSPGSPASTLHSAADRNWEPSALNKSDRSATGMSLRNMNIHFGSTPKPNHPRTHARKRSTSVNNFNAMISTPDAFSRPAETGAGLKARRMSINLPDDFVVDTVALDKEFTSASKLPGKRGKFIGRGATATVKLMIRKGNGDELYAVKEFRKRGQNEDPEEYDKKVKSEYTIAKSLHHPNIVESVRLCTHAGRWNVVMEYCHHGELFSLIEKKYLESDDHLCLFKQLLRGVNYLHSHGVAHRDIKLENLLMNNKGHLKITDFGVSDVFCGEHPGLREAGGECGKNMKEFRRCAPGICGSLPYIAPEVLEKKGDYDPRPLDVWSCAVVMLSMVFGGQPWSEASRSQPAYAKFAISWDKFEANKAAGKVTDACVPVDPGPMFKAISKPALRSLILRMMHPDPEKRIKIHDAVNEGWVKLIDCCAHEEVDGDSAKEIDASKKTSGKAAKMVVAKSHHHQPPEKRWAPQHRFDMGEGWS